MSYDEFILTIENDEVPGNLTVYVQSLWYDAKGDWHKAHSLVVHQLQTTFTKLSATFTATHQPNAPNGFK